MLVELLSLVHPGRASEQVLVPAARVVTLGADRHKPSDDCPVTDCTCVLLPLFLVE